MRLRAMRRDRAFHLGPALFIHERVFADILERITLVRRRFASALLVGCPDPNWRERLLELADTVEVLEPGGEFARAAGGEPVIEDRWASPPAQYDLCVAAGTLDTINDLPAALRSLRAALQPDSFLIGAIPGGNTLPQLRRAMHAADVVAGAASPHVHPRIEPAALATLIAASGFTDVVSDVERAQVSYRDLQSLVSDLRLMGATNILIGRAAVPLSRRAVAAASAAFAAAGDGSRTIETFEILHFGAWTGDQPESRISGR